MHFSHVVQIPSIPISMMIALFLSAHMTMAATDQEVLGLLATGEYCKRGIRTQFGPSLARVWGYPSFGGIVLAHFSGAEMKWP